MNILGINAYHGNASAALVCEGKLVAAVEEERFNRVKYAAGFPEAAVRYCLRKLASRSMRSTMWPCREIRTRGLLPNSSMRSGCLRSRGNGRG